MFIQLLTEESSYLTVSGNHIDRSTMTAGATATFQVFSTIYNEELAESDFVHGQEVILEEAFTNNFVKPDWGNTTVTMGPAEVWDRHNYRMVVHNVANPHLGARVNPGDRIALRSPGRWAWGARRFVYEWLRNGGPSDMVDVAGRTDGANPNANDRQTFKYVPAPLLQSATINPSTFIVSGTLLHPAPFGGAPLVIQSFDRSNPTVPFNDPIAIAENVASGSGAARTAGCMCPFKVHVVPRWAVAGNISAKEVLGTDVQNFSLSALLPGHGYPQTNSITATATLLESDSPTFTLSSTSPNVVISSHHLGYMGVFPAGVPKPCDPFPITVNAPGPYCIRLTQASNLPMTATRKRSRSWMGCQLLRL